MQWFNSVSTGSFSIGSLFQTILSYWQEPEDAFFMQAMDDEHYQAYSQWCSELRRAERSLRKLLERKQLSPAMLQNALLTPLANLSSSLISPLYYYLHLKKLELTLTEKNYPTAFKESVQGVGYRLKTLLKENPELTRNYFYQDIINHLIELSAQRFSSSKLLNWLSFYEKLVEETLYHSVKRALATFVKEHPTGEIGACHYKTLVVQLNSFFQETYEAENGVEAMSAEKSSSINYSTLALAGLALIGGYAVRQVGNSYHVEQGLAQAGWQSFGVMGTGIIAWSAFSHNSFSNSLGYSWSLPVLAGSLPALFPLTAGQIINGVLELSSLTDSYSFAIYEGTQQTVSSIASGDINGDGIKDLLIGANYGGPGGSSYIVFGQAGFLPTAVELSALNGTNGFVITGVGGADQSGASIASGDINADGIADVLIGAPTANPGGRSQAGTSYVIFGHTAPFPATLGLSTLNGTNGFALNGVTANDHSGNSIACGDFNTDGIADVLIGAKYASPGNRTLAGAIYVVFGHPGSFPAVLELSTLFGGNGFVINGVKAQDQLGISIASGNINADGKGDVLIGAYQASPSNRTQAGASYVVFGHPGPFPAALNLSSLDGTNGFVINGVSANNGLGVSIASGDINGDNITDVLIGAPFASPNGLGAAGASYVVFGHSGSFPAELELSTLNGTNGFVINGVKTNDILGASIASGDFDGNGIVDVLIGAYQASPGGRSYAGTSYVVFGHTGTFPAVLELSTLNGTNGFAINGVNAYDWSGQAIASGDLNGDGKAEVLLIAPNGLGGSSYVYGVFGTIAPSPSSSPSHSPTPRPSPTKTPSPSNFPSVSNAPSTTLSPSISPPSSRHTQGISAQTKIAIGVSLAAFGLFAVGSGIIAYKLYQRRKVQLLDLEMRGAHLSNNKERRAIERFVLINDLDVNEAQTLYEQTGIRVDIADGEQRRKVILGEGEFGKVKLAYDLDAHEFVGVKKIKGARAMEASEQERLIHKRLNGLPHILPLLHSKITEDSQRKPAFYQFIRLAGFGNGEKLRQQLAQVTDDELKWKFIQHVMQGLLTGIASMHGKNTYHLDLKPQNYMLTIAGMVYVIDFGCTREFKPGEACWIDDGATGDASCFSPERLANFRYVLLNKGQTIDPASEVVERYEADKADAWSVGLVLLELILCHYPLSDEHVGFVSRLNHWDTSAMNQLLTTAYAEVTNKGLLTSQRGHTLFEIVQGLLTIDPAQRLTVIQALKHPLFEKTVFKAEELTDQFRALKELGMEGTIENNTGSIRQDISLYSATTTSHCADPNYGSVASLALKG